MFRFVTTLYQVPHHTALKWECNVSSAMIPRSKQVFRLTIWNSSHDVNTTKVRAPHGVEPRSKMHDADGKALTDSKIFEDNNMDNLRNGISVSSCTRRSEGNCIRRWRRARVDALRMPLIHFCDLVDIFTCFLQSVSL